MVICAVLEESCGELRSVGGSINLSKDSPMSVRTANALIEKSVQENAEHLLNGAQYCVESW